MADIKVFKPTSSYKDTYNSPVEQKKQYTDSWLEWAAKNRQQFTSWNFAQNSTATVYTCPDGYTSYITNVSLALHTTGATAGDTYVTKSSLSPANRLLQIGVLNGAGAGNSTTQNQVYPCPIKLNAGESIFVVSNSATIVGNCQIFGFLELNPSQ